MFLKDVSEIDWSGIRNPDRSVNDWTTDAICKIKSIVDLHAPVRKASQTKRDV